MIRLFLGSSASKRSTSSSAIEGALSDLSSNSRLSLQHMPDPVLLKIISHIPAVNGEQKERGFLSIAIFRFFTIPKKWELSVGDRIEKSIDCFNTLGRVNRNLNRLVKEDYTRGVFVKALMERYEHLLLKELEEKHGSPFLEEFKKDEDQLLLTGAFGKSKYIEGVFNRFNSFFDRLNFNSLNLDLVALEIGFRLRVKDRDHGLSQIASLDQRIRILTDALFERAGVAFQWEDSSPSIEYEIGRVAEKTVYTGLENFEIDFYFKKLRIFTPFHVIEFRKILPKEPRPKAPSTHHLPLLSIAEALIKRLGATFESASFPPSNTNCYEISGFDFSHGIRKIEKQQLIRMKGIEDVKSAKGTQRVIVPEKGFSRYRIREIGGSVLDLSEKSKKTWKKSLLFVSAIYCGLPK